MADKSGGTANSEAAGSPGTERSEGQRTRRKRGRSSGRGLGMGLGALIPTREPEATGQEPRPLDVLFPDLTDGKHSGVPRGGSARDLLEPRGKLRTVSRETVAAGESEVSVSADGVTSEAGERLSSFLPDDGEAVVDQVPGTDATQERGVLAPAAGAASGELPEDAADNTAGIQLAAGVSSDQSDSEAHRVESAARDDAGSSLHVNGSVSRETVRAGDEIQPGEQDARGGTRDQSAELKPSHQDAEVQSGSPEAEPGGQNSESGSTDTEEIVLPAVPGVTFGNVAPDQIVPNTMQPRQVFDGDELEQLAESVADVGILQPIVVRRITAEALSSPDRAEKLLEYLKERPEARYELIMGERRWRAAQLANLETVPVIVRETSDSNLLREALIENIHRVQLNPLEEAAAYGQLMEDFGYTQEQLASRVSKSRSQVANSMRLLNLPSMVQRMLVGGSITAGHARALLGLGSSLEMQALASRIVSEGLSVRSTEEIVRHGSARQVRSRKRAGYTPNANQQKIIDALGERLETTVKLTAGEKKGRISIEFADEDDLLRIAQALGVGKMDTQ